MLSEIIILAYITFSHKIIAVAVVGEWVRYLVEWGCGATLRHEDPTLAAKRAVLNAMSHVCPLDFESLGGVDMEKDLMVEIIVGVPQSDKVNVKEILGLVPYKCEKKVKVVEGGLMAKGVYDKDLGRYINVIIAVAFITIYVRRTQAKP